MKRLRLWKAFSLHVRFLSGGREFPKCWRCLSAWLAIGLLGLCLPAMAERMEMSTADRAVPMDAVDITPEPQPDNRPSSYLPAEAETPAHEAPSLPTGLIPGLIPGLPLIQKPLSMREAIETALENNLNLAESRAETGVREALLRQARAKRQPVIRLGSNTFLHNRDNQTLMTPDMMMTTGQSRFFQDFNVSARMPLFAGGGLVAGVRASRFFLEGARAETRTAMAETAYQTRLAYLQAALSHEEHRIHRQHITVQQTMLANAEARYRAGRGLKADMLRIRTGLADAYRMLNEEHAQLNQAMLDLKAVLGADLASGITLTDTIDFAPWPGDPLPVLMDRAVRENPKIRTTEAAMREAEAQLRVARAAYLPQVYGQVSGNLRFRADPPMMGNGVVGMLTASLPVWDRTRSAEVAQALARLNKTRLALRSAMLEVGKTLAKAGSDLYFAEKNVRLSDAAVSQAEEDLRLMRRRVGVGRAIQLEVLDAALALREARLNRIRAVYAYERAKAELWRASGKTGIE